MGQEDHRPPSSSIKPRLEICQTDTWPLPSPAGSRSVRRGHQSAPTGYVRLRRHSDLYNPFSFIPTLLAIHPLWEVTGQPMDAGGGKSSCDTRWRVTPQAWGQS